MFIEFFKTDKEITKINTDFISIYTISTNEKTNKEFVTFVMSDGRVMKSDEESVVSAIKKL